MVFKRVFPNIDDNSLSKTKQKGKSSLKKTLEVFPIQAD